MNEISNQFVISIMSRDRVGIVHEVANAISQVNGNIADIRQSVLCGYFTMILLAEFPPEVTQRDLERKFAEVDANSETSIDAIIKPVDTGTSITHTKIPDHAYVLTATGTDKIGFVSTVSSFCVKHSLNILDLSTTVSDGMYVMILIVELSTLTAIDDLRKDLRQFTHDTRLNVVFQHYDIFRAVNEINLPTR